MQAEHPLEVPKKAPKKLGQPLVKVEHNDRDMDDAFAGVSELGHDASERSFAFGVAKLALDGNAVDFILPFEPSLRVEFSRVFGGRLFGPAQRLATKADPSLLAVFSVLASPVNGIGMNAGRVMPEALFVGFNLRGQVAAFVIGIPTDRIDTDEAFPLMTDSDFSAKLDTFTGLSPNDGTHVWLTYADDPIGHAMHLLRIHLLLLLVKGLNNQQALVVITRKVPKHTRLRV